jgi:tetratricopeptide (TPR) repeat protein
MFKPLLFFYFFAVMLFSVNVVFAQDMSPEAGKLFNEGNKYLKEGNYNKAIEIYDKALAVEKDARIYYQKGMALRSSGKNGDSKEAFKKSVELNPGFDAGYNALGSAYYSEGNFYEAVQNFEKVLEVTKNNSTKSRIKKNLSLSYTKLGEAAVNSGNSQKGIEYFNKAVEANKYDAAYLHLAKIHNELGNYDDAIRAAQGALDNRSSVTKGGPYYYLGVAHKNKGETDKAKEMFNLAKADATYRKTAEYELTLLK